VPLPAPSDARFRVQGRRKDRASLPRKAKAQVPKFNQSSTTKWSTATRAYGLECFARAYEPPEYLRHFKEHQPGPPSTVTLLVLSDLVPRLLKRSARASKRSSTKGVGWMRICSCCFSLGILSEMIVEFQV